MPDVVPVRDASGTARYASVQPHPRADGVRTIQATGQWIDGWRGRYRLRGTFRMQGSIQADESNADVWSLPVDPHGAVIGPARHLTDHTNQAFSATVSWDGSKITYRLRDKDGLERAWFKDLATGKDHALQPRQEPSDPPMISPDGSRVAFTAEAGEGP